VENLSIVIFIEVAMTLFLIWVIYYLRSDLSNLKLKTFSVSVFFLAMMASMFNGITYYLVTPSSFINTVLAVNVSMILMTVAIVYLLVIAAKGEFTGISRSISGTLSFLLVWNEISMAVLLRVIAFGTTDQNSFVDSLSFFSLSITSILFLLPMLTEMVVFIFLQLRSGIDKEIAISILLMQIGDPVMFGNSRFISILLIAYSVLMIVSIVYFFRAVYRNRKIFDQSDGKRSKERNIAIDFVFLFLLTSLSFIGPLILPGNFGLSYLVFAISMIIAMSLYFNIIMGMYQNYNTRKLQEKTVTG